MLKFNHKTIVTEYILNLPASEHSEFTLDHTYFDKENDYKFNKSGYRCDEFDIPHDISVVTIGCSNGFGYSLENKHRFSELFISKLANHTNKRVANWNLSLPGKSNDYMSRIALAMPHTLKPNIVLVSFADIARREYFDANFKINKNKECYDHIPSNHPKIVKQFRPHFLETSQNFINMSSPHEDYLNFYKNYKLIEMTCKLHNIQFLFIISSWPNIQLPKKIDHGISKELYVGVFNTVDFAKDECHPGIKSNKKIAKKFWSRYKNVYMDQNKVD